MRKWRLEIARDRNRTDFPRRCAGCDGFAKSGRFCRLAMAEFIGVLQVWCGSIAVEFWGDLGEQSALVDGAKMLVTPLFRDLTGKRCFA